MRYVLLGKSGLRVSELALGTMTFGEAWGFGSNLDECKRMFEVYAEAGGNFIDTANKYTEGSAERFLGELMGHDRERFVLATKYTLVMRPGDPNANGNHRKNMVQSVEASLRRLNTDYLDLYWVHAWDFTTPEEEVMRALDDLVRAGKVLHVGVSDVPAWVVARCNTLAELRGWSAFVALQVPYNLIERTVERELIPMAEALGMGLVTWAPLAGGVLTGKYTRGAEADTRRKEMNAHRLTERGLAVAQTLDAVADEAGVSSTCAAIAWIRQRSRRIVPIVGARKPSQLEESLKAVDVTLTEEQVRRLDEASAFELGFPQDFLAMDGVQDVVFGDTRDRLVR